MKPSRAELRLRSAMAAAGKAGDLSAWLVAAASLQDLLARRDPDGAARAGLRQEMVGACDDLRRRWHSRPGRWWVAQQADQVTGPLLRDLLDDADPDTAEVFQLTEAARARVLLDALSGCFHGDSGDPQETSRADQILRFAPETNPDPLLREMRLISAVRAADDESAAERRESLAAVESMYEAPDTGFQDGAEPAGLADVQAGLRADEVLVEYVVPYHPLHPSMGLAALVITHHDARLVPELPLPEQYTSGFIGSYFIDGRAPVDASPMGDMVTSARRAVQGDDPVTAFEAGRMLYDVLVGPLFDRPPARCIVVPHRQLHPVPWQALIDPTGARWLDSTTVTVCPSASVWLQLAGRSRTGRSALALGDPLLGYAGMTPLPQARAEAEHLGEVWHAAGLPADVHTGAHANLAALRQEGPDASVVHLATHASFPDTPTGEDHQLLLSLSAGSSGRLPASTLRTLDLRHAWCATLSVCNGGLYRIGPGDEPLGLIPAALEAGATTVIAAQWAVGDDAGRRLMSRFVEHLPGSDPAVALRRAALAMADEGALPRDWAAFVATGSGRGPG